MSSTESEDYNYYNFNSPIIKELFISNLTWPSEETQNALLNSSFMKIPNEIIIHIFRFLSIRDLCNISLVCRSFKMIADHDDIWKLKFNVMKLHSKSYKHMYLEWMHEKYSRNIQLNQLRRQQSCRTPCIFRRPPPYPCRSPGKHHFQSIGGFTQHPNATPEMTIKLSINIDYTAPQLISLLQQATRFNQQWQQSHVLKQMIQRYYRFMQLKASQPSNLLLIPTLDIEIIWQTHLLRPKMYQNDCVRLFHRIIDHSLILNDPQKFFKKQAFIDTCELYEQKYGVEYCSLSLTKHKNELNLKLVSDRYNLSNNNKPSYSYWDETHFEFSSDPPNDYENPFSFTESDIILDGKWYCFCKEFMSNALEKVPGNASYYYSSSGISLEKDGLKRLKKSYERFLYMAAKYPLNDANGFIPPTYAIDIIWHSHMQEPLKYVDDCIRLVGYVLIHDPWPVVEDDKMKKSCDQVDKMWKDEFDCDLEVDHLINIASDQDDIDMFLNN